MKKIKPYLFLNLILFLYSMGGVCSKIAAGKEFLSFKETISISNIIGAVIVLGGVLLMVTGGEKKNE